MSTTTRETEWTWELWPTAQQPGLVTVTGPRGEVTRYYVAEDMQAHPSFGRCFHVEKFAADDGTDKEERAYSVTVGTTEQLSCSCRGWLRWRTPCRHIQVCQEVVEEPNGRINGGCGGGL